MLRPFACLLLAVVVHSCGPGLVFLSKWTFLSFTIVKTDYNAIHDSMYPVNKITKREWTPPFDFYHSLIKQVRFCEPGVVTFSRRHLLFACRRTSRRLLGESWWGSHQLRMLT